MMILNDNCIVFLMLIEPETLVILHLVMSSRLLIQLLVGVASDKALLLNLLQKQSTLH